MPQTGIEPPTFGLSRDLVNLAVNHCVNLTVWILKVKL